MEEEDKGKDMLTGGNSRRTIRRSRKVRERERKGRKGKER